MDLRDPSTLEGSDYAAIVVVPASGDELMMEAVEYITERVDTQSIIGRF